MNAKRATVFQGNGNVNLSVIIHISSNKVFHCARVIIGYLYGRDLFTSSFFNYQGANMGVTIYSFILFIPLAIYAICTLALPPLWGDAVMAAIGLLGTLAHPLWLKNIYKRFMQRRYQNMEGFRSSR